MLLALVLLLLLRRPPALRDGLPPELPDPDPVARMPVGRAALAALVVGAALGFVFAARSAPLIAVGTFLILWRGIGAARARRRGRRAAAGRSSRCSRSPIPVRDPGASTPSTRTSGSPSTG